MFKYNKRRDVLWNGVYFERKDARARITRRENAALSRFPLRGVDTARDDAHVCNVIRYRYIYIVRAHAICDFARVLYDMCTEYIIILHWRCSADWRPHVGRALHERYRVQYDLLTRDPYHAYIIIIIWLFHFPPTPTAVRVIRLHGFFSPDFCEATAARCAQNGRPRVHGDTETTVKKKITNPYFLPAI